MNENEFLAQQLVHWVDAINDPVLKNSKVIKTGFPYIYRRFEYLKTTTILASEAALKEYERVFGNTIPLAACDWETSLNPIIPNYSDPYKRNPTKFKKILVRDVLHWEHFDTAHDFKEQLQGLWESNKGLDVKEVTKLLKKLRMCWITKQENKRLDIKYKTKRPRPECAYEKCGIKVNLL